MSMSDVISDRISQVNRKSFARLRKCRRIAQPCSVRAFSYSLKVGAQTRARRGLNAETMRYIRVGGAVSADYPSGRKPLTVGYCPDKLPAGGVGVVPAAPEGVRDLKQNLVGKPQRIDV